MKSDSEAIVDAFYAAWRARDIAAGLAYCTDDIHIIFHFGPALLFSGESHGKDAARLKLGQSEHEWEFLELRQIYLHVDPGLVRCSCPFVFRHTRSGFLLEGTLRHIFTFRDGLICKFEAYIDIAMLNSALRMLGLRVTS